MSFSLTEYTKIDVGFAPDPTGGAYSAPRLPSWFQGAASQQEGNGGEEREELEEGGRGEGGGKWEWEGRGKGISWGNSALVVGG